MSVADIEHGGVRLADGELVPADVIVVGIGVTPATYWLDGSGLEIRDGVVCDATLAAGPAGVYAAGDVARWQNDLFDEEMRVEHWTNAAEQGAAAARNLLAAAAGSAGEPYAPVPFVWSDQGRNRAQFLGRPAGDEDDDVVEVVVGDPAERRFVALYGRHGSCAVCSGSTSRAWSCRTGRCSRPGELGRRACTRRPAAKLSRLRSTS